MTDLVTHLPSSPRSSFVLQLLYTIRCGGELQLVAVTDGSGVLLYNHPLPYLDSR